MTIVENFYNHDFFEQVILDADVAELYGVETKRINEAVSKTVSPV